MKKILTLLFAIFVCTINGQKVKEQGVKVNFNFNQAYISDLKYIGEKITPVPRMSKTLNLGYFISNKIGSKKIETGIYLTNYRYQKTGFNIEPSTAWQRKNPTSVYWLYRNIEIPFLLGFEKKDFCISGGPGLSLNYWHSRPRSSKYSYQQEGYFSYFLPTINFQISVAYKFHVSKQLLSVESNASLYNNLFYNESNNGVFDIRKNPIFFNFGLGIRYYLKQN